MPKHPIATHPTPWREILLVCRKCSKKLDGGFGPGGELTLPRALKQALRGSGQHRTTRIVETKCFGLCPKNAVTILPASNPANLYTVPIGTDPATLLATLLPSHPPPT